MSFVRFLGLCLTRNLCVPFSRAESLTNRALALGPSPELDKGAPSSTQRNELSTVGGGQNSLLAERVPGKCVPVLINRPLQFFFGVQFPILCALILHGNRVLDA